jgi:hypothetical protein
MANQPRPSRRGQCLVLQRLIVAKSPHFLTGCDNRGALIDPDRSLGSYPPCIMDTATRRHGVSTSPHGTAHLLLGQSTVLTGSPTRSTPHTPPWSCADSFSISVDSLCVLYQCRGGETLACSCALVTESGPTTSGLLEVCSRRVRVMWLVCLAEVSQSLWCAWPAVRGNPVTQ